MFNLEQNLTELRRQYSAAGVATISGFVKPEYAEALRAEILGLQWEMAYVLNGKPAKMLASEVAQLTPDQQQLMFKQIRNEAARNQYSFVYDTYMLITHYLQKTLKAPVLREYVETISSLHVLNFLRELTANQSLIKADAQASRYLPGHYLKTHDDSGVSFEQSRIAAYTISLSKNWQADWGGILHLQDQDFNITKSLIPEFCALNVFSVPQQHFVSQVANYCPEQRLSIVGWLRSDLN